MTDGIALLPLVRLAEIKSLLSSALIGMRAISLFLKDFFLTVLIVYKVADLMLMQSRLGV